VLYGQSLLTAAVRLAREGSARPEEKWKVDMKRRGRIISSLIVVGLALLLPILQGCSAATIEARPQTMDRAADTLQEGERA